MDPTTVKILILVVVGLLVMGALLGELRPRRRASRTAAHTGGGNRWSRS